MFLSSYEANLIRRDYRWFLQSAETSAISIVYQKPVDPTYDPVYDRTLSDDWETITEDTKASQKIITPADEEILKWGILQVGDCLFFLLETLDLYDYEDHPITIRVHETPTLWEVIPRASRDVYERLGFRLGNTQVAQLFAARLKQDALK